jgi:hypothetical protein
MYQSAQVRPTATAGRLHLFAPVAVGPAMQTAMPTGAFLPEPVTKDYFSL